jgi:hypothetical protein
MTVEPFGLELWRYNRTARTLAAYDMKAGQKRLAPVHPAIREPKRLWQTDIGMCQKRADTYSACPCRPRPDYSP